MTDMRELIYTALQDQHALMRVVSNIYPMYCMSVAMTAKSLHRPVDRKNETLGISMIDTARLARAILDARVEFFHDIALPAKAHYKGKTRDIIYYCLDCGKSDCPNAEIGVAMELDESTDE